MACNIFWRTEQCCYITMFFCKCATLWIKEKRQSLSNNPQSKWRLWGCKFKEEVAKKVTQFKEKQRRPINVAQEQALHTKLCNYIASLKSTQEFEPILGPVIQKYKMWYSSCGKKNCWGHWYKLLFTHVLAKAKIPTSTKSVFQLPKDNSMQKHLKALRFKFKCQKLYNKILRWFKEKKSSPFKLRLTGKETKKFCDGFMYLVEVQIKEGNIDQAKSSFVLPFRRMGLHLRNNLSLASRVSSDLPKLEQDCRKYFNLASLFHSANLSV